MLQPDSSPLCSHFESAGTNWPVVVSRLINGWCWSTALIQTSFATSHNICLDMHSYFKRILTFRPRERFRLSLSNLAYSLMCWKDLGVSKASQLTLNISCFFFRTLFRPITFTNPNSLLPFPEQDVCVQTASGTLPRLCAIPLTRATTSCQ